MTSATHTAPAASQPMASWPHLIAVFGFSLLVYYLTLPRAITLEDAGLFQMVCQLGGIAHPPGYPLHTQLCQSFVQLPIFDQSVFAGNFLSGLFGATAVAVLHQISFWYKGRPFAWLSSLVYAFSATFWSQAIIIEVYTLAVLMFMLCWYCTALFVRTSNLKYFYLLGILYGLSLSNHWPLMILSTPGLLILLSDRVDILRQALRRPGFWLLSMLCLALGLSPYLLLFNPEPTIGVFGGIDSVQGFIRYVTRAMYHDGQGIANLGDKFSFAGWLLQETFRQTGYWSLPLVLIGIWHCMKSMPLRFTLFLASTYLGSTFVLWLMINFDFEYYYRAIFKPYPIIAYLAIAIWFAFGVEVLFKFVASKVTGKHLSRVIPVVAVILVLISNWVENDRSDNKFSEKYAHAVLASLPQDSVLFVEGDFETSLIGYLNLVKGVRSDIELFEWDGLVFSNRLFKPFSKEATRVKAVTRFIQSTNREVFYLGRLIDPAIDLGIVYQFDRFGENKPRLSLELDQFSGYLLEYYNQKGSKDPHESYLAYQLMIRISRFYISYALQSEAHRQEVQYRLDSLQQSFPGTLATLEAMIEEKRVSNDNRSDLLRMARLADAQIPEMASNASLAVFYDYFAQLLEMDSLQAEQAMTYYEKSVRAYPSEENQSICNGRRLARVANLSDKQFTRFHSECHGFGIIEP